LYPCSEKATETYPEKDDADVLDPIERLRTRARWGPWKDPSGVELTVGRSKSLLMEYQAKAITLV